MVSTSGLDPALDGETSPHTPNTEWEHGDRVGRINAPIQKREGLWSVAIL